VLAGRPEVEFLSIRARGIERQLSPQAALALGETVLGLSQALMIVTRVRPDLIVGTGGYAAFAPLLAGVLLKIPTAIHEQNVIPGLVTRLLAPWVDRVWLSYPETGESLRAQHTAVTGVPLRAAVLELRALSSRDAKAALGLDPRRPLLLVLGGSLGSCALHEAVLRGLEPLEREGVQLAVIAGREAGRLRGQLAERASGAQSVVIMEHTPEIARWMRASDLVISRAGGTTLAELMALGVPALVVPWPGAAAGHQEANARWWAERGACHTLSEDQLRKTGGDCLVEESLALLRDGPRAARLAARARELGRPGALDHVMKEVEPYLDPRTDPRTVSLHRHRRRWHERAGLGAPRSRPLRPRLGP
jgi:UDP-N-acetylglucosamine--N-acetylmuramyl-(pentapeptide) pyrophosphoryl-undecaprenol N-acetylglucosamine transferase